MQGKSAHEWALLCSKLFVGELASGVYMCVLHLKLQLFAIARSCAGNFTCCHMLRTPFSTGEEMQHQRPLQLRFPSAMRRAEM